MSCLQEKKLWLPGFSLVLMLAACRSEISEPGVPDSVSRTAEPEQQIQAQSEEQMRAWEIAFRRQRLIGDLLYDALKALQQDRLLVPLDDNAHARYRRVLALDPENPLALQGLQDIVNRYLELAATASRQGRFTDADDYIDRARFVDSDNPAITLAREALEQDRNSGDLVFELDLGALDAQSTGLVEQLARIANQAVQHEAFVWITAPSDEKGRWIYGILRDHADGYRLRGNIELGGQATIRLRLPDTANAGAAVGNAEPG